MTLNFRSSYIHPSQVLCSQACDLNSFSHSFHTASERGQEVQADSSGGSFCLRITEGGLPCHTHSTEQPRGVKKGAETLEQAALTTSQLSCD